MNHLSPTTITGLDLGILMSAIVWIKDCPFSTTAKPDVEMTGKEMDDFYNRLTRIWVRLREPNSIEKARSERATLDLTSREICCLRVCLHGVLEECDGNPLELELRVGKTEDVQRLVSELELMAT